jgi:predicted ATPase
LDEAQNNFLRSLEVSRRQGAAGWEQRAAVDLTELWVGEGRTKEAHDLLHPVLDRFLENDETADLKLARRLLAGLS